MEKILLLGGSGLVGRAITEALEKDYLVIPTSGHHKPEKGYCLAVENTKGLLEILERENPNIVISSLRGDFQEQMNFHSELANWLKGKNKRLLYISTANVFDGDLSRPWKESDPPVPESDYGIFKRDCENMLGNLLKENLTVFRLPSVWDIDCPRIQSLISGKPHPTYSGSMVNITYTNQIGAYAKYVLKHRLSGIFHVGTTDLTDYFDFEKMVCEALDIKPPKFDIKLTETKAFQAVIPSRKRFPMSCK